MAVVQMPARRRHMSALRRREAIAGLLFVLPWIVGILAFTVYPILASLYFSFTDYNIVQPPRWTGFSNYTAIFTSDTDFITGVQNSAYYALISVPLGLVLSLVLALVLNLRVRGVGIYRSLFYLPSLAPPVASTIVFLMLLDPSHGVVNVFLTTLGLPAPAWFSDPSWTKPALILLSLWTSGTATIIFLAGLQEIPQSLIEAAMIDGAGRWQRFWKVILPLLSPVVLFNLVMGVIYSFQVFTQAYIVGHDTGDPVGSTLMYMTLIYRSAFKYFRMGYASALAVLLFVAIVTVTFVIFRVSRAWVFYEGEQHNA
ncbi:MAG: binding-protein-dependent transport system inner rane component [Chloroflexi bacterium]|nr:binding-protein-dependent transport system inner rane component [Chloroflexota bacterium]